jgi:O-succinylbenzoic acid--CoA ligase
MPAVPSRRLVALALPPGEEFIRALEAAWQAGSAVLPIDPNAPKPVADRLLADMRVDEPVDGDVALVIPTSGSTGEPKGAQLSREALDASARATHSRIGHEKGDRWLSCLPWHHIGGIQVMLRARLLDIPLTIHERFDHNSFSEVQDATLTSIVPTQLVRLLDAGTDLSRFRAILLGGAAAPESLLDRARAAGANVIPTYGMSETCGGCVYDGRPLDGIDVALDAGRVRVRGPVLMAGYRMRPDLDAEAFDHGWFVTSDLGEYGADGRLQITGRVDDVVITGGENVVASQVAEVLAAHPSIAEVAVTGVPDAEWGQRVVAVIVPAAGDVVPTLADLREWGSERLSPAARPQAIVVVTELPRLATGKVDRLAVRRLAGRSGDAGDL